MTEYEMSNRAILDKVSLTGLVAAGEVEMGRVPYDKTKYINVNKKKL
jgi:hypothetical protein